MIFININNITKLMDVIPMFAAKICYSFAPARTKESLNQTSNTIIMIVGKCPKITTTELTKHINMDLGALSRTVNLLVKENYIVKIKDDNDKRQAFLKLSESGAEIFNNLHDQLDLHFEKLLSSLTEDEKTELEVALHTIKRINGKLKG